MVSEINLMHLLGVVTATFERDLAAIIDAPLEWHVLVSNSPDDPISQTGIDKISSSEPSPARNIRSGGFGRDIGQLTKFLSSEAR
jgi:hypothetical protein